MNKGMVSATSGMGEVLRESFPKKAPQPLHALEGSLSSRYGH